MNVLVDDVEREVTIETIVVGAGPEVILLPSALRGASDFARLQGDLATAGFRSIAVNMRGVGQSRGPDSTFELSDLADDIACVITRLCQGPAHVVGHALGNIIARATASYRPNVVRSVVVMPCGGHNLSSRPISTEVLHHFVRCHELDLPDDERRKSLSVAFFAPGNDPGSWLDGWWPGASAVSAAAQRTSPELWWRAGTVPILILQPMEDAMAAPETGRDAAAALGDRATYVEIPQCGHAILPEQPDLIAGHIISFLRARSIRA